MQRTRTTTITYRAVQCLLGLRKTKSINKFNVCCTGVIITTTTITNDKCESCKL